jgi:hypothetical protein
MDHNGAVWMIDLLTQAKRVQCRLRMEWEDIQKLVNYLLQIIRNWLESYTRRESVLTLVYSDLSMWCLEWCSPHLLEL